MLVSTANRSRLGCITVALALSLCAKISAQKQQCTENKAQLEKACDDDATAVKKSQFSAIVVGGTGATGRQVVNELLLSDKWSSVTVLTRYPPNTFQYEATNTIERDAKKKLAEKLVRDWSIDKIEIDMPHADAIFLCLGTTLYQAGCPEALEKIEVEYTAKAAVYAKKAGVKHGAVVSSLGADSATYVPSIYLHPLFYLRTMGRKQQAVLDVGFLSTSIWRPGMLNRLKGDRYWENVMDYLGFGK